MDQPAAPLRRLGQRLMLGGVLLLVASLPLSLSAMNVGFALAVLGLILARPALGGLPGLGCGVLFGAWVLLSGALVASRGGQRPVDALAFVAVSWLALPLTAVALREARWRRRAAQVLCAALVAAALLAVLQFLIGFDRQRGPLRIDAHGPRFAQVSGALGYHLTYGGVLALVGALLFAARPPLARWPCALARGAVVVGLGVSLARLAILGFAVGIGAGLAARGRRHLAWGALAALASLALGLGVLAAVSPRKVDDLLHGRDGRWAIWEVSWSMVVDQPLTGVGGRRAFIDEYQRRWAAMIAPRPQLFAREPRMPHAHNSQLVLLSQYGTPALLLHLALLFAIGHAAWRGRHAAPERWRATCALLATWLAIGQFNNTVGQSEYALAFYACLGMATVLPPAQAALLTGDAPAAGDPQARIAS